MNNIKIQADIIDILFKNKFTIEKSIALLEETITSIKEIDTLKLLRNDMLCKYERANIEN